MVIDLSLREVTLIRVALLRRLSQLAALIEMEPENMIDLAGSYNESRDLCVRLAEVRTEFEIQEQLKERSDVLET